MAFHSSITRSLSRSLNAAELAGTLAHEVMHPALQHHTRRGDRDSKRWNMACDYAINPMLIDAGLVLPKDVLPSDRFRLAMSAERIYNLIEEEDNQGSSNGTSQRQDEPAGVAPPDEKVQNSDDADAEGDPTAPTTPGGIGQVLDAPEPEDGGGKTVAEQAREWQIAVEQAQSVAKLAGKMPVGTSAALLNPAQAARVDWRGFLRRAWSETIPADYSWIRPNRRHVWAGLYLPGITSEGVGEIAIAVDCSGSVSARQLGLFEAEIRSILAGQQPRLIHVLYFDAEVHKVKTYPCWGTDLALTPVGGGGTDFRPCFVASRERSGGVSSDSGVPHGPLWNVSGRSAAVFGDLGVHRESAGATFGQVVPMEGA